MTKSLFWLKSIKDSPSKVSVQNIIARKLTLGNLKEVFLYHLRIYLNDNESLKHFIPFIFLSLAQFILYSYGAWKMKHLEYRS